MDAKTEKRFNILNNGGLFEMKSKLLVICSSVALLHLLVGGMLFFGGCATVEEDPLPPGAYIPDAEKNVPPSNTPAEPEEPVGPTTVFVPLENQTVTPEPEMPKKTEPKKTVSVPVPPPVPDTQKTHVIRKGDTFWSLSREYGVSMDEIAAANQDLNPARLRVGQKVVIPASSGKKVKSSALKGKSAKAVRSSGKTAARTKKTTAKLVDRDGKYIVRKGDSFSRIAARYHIKAADLAAANNLSLEKPLQIGQKLVIPKPGQKIAVKPVANTASSKVKKAEAPVENKTVVPEVPAAPALPAAAESTGAPVAEPPVVPPPVPAADDAKDVSVPEPAPVSAPIASSAAVDAVAKDATPVAPALPGTAAAGYTTEINEDTTLDELAKKFGFGVAELKKLNPEIPADGKVRAGSVIELP